MEKIKRKITIGTKEWASSNVNLLSGCVHNCRYCYAKLMALRFKRKTEATWKIMELNELKLQKTYKKRKGRIMFPTSHDIVPEFKTECFKVLEKLLDSGNSVLITSKPHFEVIKELCQKFAYFRDLIQFRFTITSINNNLLKFWEEGAPNFEERFESLKYAYNNKYMTSVSIEPFLDNPVRLIKKIYPYITESIWIGKMNYIRDNNISIEEMEYFGRVRENYTLENLQKIIDTLRNYKKIRYKDSIRKLILDIPEHQMPVIKQLKIK